MIVSEKNIGTNMKIGDVIVQSAKVCLLRIPLTHPFVISLGTQYSYEGVILELHAGDITGYGEGSTIAQITGETPYAIFDTVCYIIESLKNRAYGGFEDLISDIGRSIYANSTAKNAIDIAAHDLIAKSWNLHLTSMLGGTLKELPTSFTISLGSVEESISALDSYKGMKARIIKVKVGNDPDLDIRRIKAISERLGEIPFFADANQGYNLQNAIRVGKVLNDAGALFFEQPMEKHSHDQLRFLRTQTGIPIMLDESISTPHDVVESIVRESADLINVKLVKSGGIRNSMKALAVAQAYGMDAMVGCMTESKLGIAASLAVSSSMSNVKYTDLDGFHSIAAQPFEGGVEYENGLNRPVAGTGLACISRLPEIKNV